MPAKNSETLAPKRLKLNGAEILIKCLQAEMVEHLWCYPGDTVLSVYDALAKQTSIETLTMRHEQAVVHAADGYARSSGRVGVAMVAAGSGITSATTGIASAYIDSVPLVIISGQVSTSFIGQDAYQECDAIGITRPIVKHNILVSSAQELSPAIKKAFHIAATGRPGPVLIDVTKNVWTEYITWHYPEEVFMRSYEPVLKGHSGQVKKALHLLMNAEKPCIYVGGGAVIANAGEALSQLLEHLDMPLISTMMGTGACPGTDPRFLGMSGMHGTFQANMAMHECDVLLVLGARFGDRAIGAPEIYMRSRSRTIIHADIDPSSISKRIKADVPIVGDIREVLSDMLAILKQDNYVANTKKLTPWWKQINQWRMDERALYRPEKNGSSIDPIRLIETLWKATHNDNVYIVSDAGQHQLWFAHHYPFNKSRHWVTPGGLSLTGVALPLALGVKKAFPLAEVFCISNEVAIQKNIQELASSTQHQLPVIILVMSNGHLELSKQWHTFDGEVVNIKSEMTSSTPCLQQLAQAYGHTYLSINLPEEIEPILQEARQRKNQTTLIHIKTQSDGGVYPIVPEGKGLTEMAFKQPYKEMK